MRINKSALSSIHENREIRAELAAYKNAAIKPIGVGEWMGILVLMLIPVINLVLLFVWAFGGNTDPNRSNFAIASLLLGLIVGLGWFFLVIVGITFLGG